MTEQKQVKDASVKQQAPVDGLPAAEVEQELGGQALALFGGRLPMLGQADPDAGSRQRMLVALQRSAGNAAVQRMLAPSMQRSMVIQRQVANSSKSQYTFPDKKFGKRSLSYAQLTPAVGGVVEYEVTPPTGPPGSVKPGVSASGLGSNQAPAGGGGTKVSSGLSKTSDATAYQAEISHEFGKRTSGWLEGWTPKAKIGGEASTKGYKLGIEGSIEGENIEPKFGFTFFEADEKGELTFAALEAAVDLKLFSFSYTCSDGAVAQVSVKPTFKLIIEPDYVKIGQWFLERCAMAVTAEVAIVGGFVLVGVVIIAGTILTVGDGKDMARIIDEASKARSDYVGAFVAEITEGNAAFSNDYAMEGHNRGRQWIQDLKTGAGKEGIPIPESVLKKKVKELKGQAQANAERAINAELHRLLVKQYWEIHYIRKRMPEWAGGGYIETTFKMLMEGQGFGRPENGETGEEPVEEVMI